MLSDIIDSVCRFVFDVIVAMSVSSMLLTLAQKLPKKWGDLILLAYATMCIVLTVKGMIKARKEREFYNNHELIEVDMLED